MTLVEVLISMVILSIAAAGLLHGVLAGLKLNYASAQHAAAFGLCLDAFEQMRGAGYENVLAVNYPATTQRLTHLGGSQRLPIHCQRACRITDFSNPSRKEVEVNVSWMYLGKPQRETLNGVIFKRL